MSRIRTNSSPNLIPGTSTLSDQEHDDSALEGVAAPVRLLLKLTQDHKDACDKEKNDKRRMLRVATMMTIIDNIRDRIQKCQSFGDKEGSDSQLRQCNTDRERRDLAETMADEKEKLRRELNASLASRKSLEIMCSSLGKEKEIMAAELSRKVHELSGMEELVNDLKAQNETLLEKVREYASSMHKEKRGGEPKGNIALQEKNRVLSEQLLRSLDGYKSMKRMLKEVQEENLLMRSTMDEMGAKVETNLERVQSFKERVSEGNDSPVDVQEEIVVLENMFKNFKVLVEKHGQKQGECVKSKGEINVSKASVLA